MAQIHRSKNLSHEKLRRMRFSPGSVFLLILSLILLPISIWAIVQIVLNLDIGIKVWHNISLWGFDFLEQFLSSTNASVMEIENFLPRISLALIIFVIYFIGLCLAFILGIWGGILCYALPPFILYLSAHRIFTFLTNPSAYENSEAAILRVGLEGEEKALNMVRNLSNRCHIYTNLVIPYDRRTSETDMIAVTPSGVTIIEVKNLKGTLHGDFSDEKLTHRKHLRNGSYEDKTLYNPVRQVSTHVYRLAHYLRSRGISIHVRCCVLFVDPGLSIYDVDDYADIRFNKCPVFCAKDQIALKDYLFSAFSTPLDDASVKRIVSELNKLL